MGIKRLGGLPLAVALGAKFVAEHDRVAVVVPQQILDLERNLALKRIDHRLRTSKKWQKKKKKKKKKRKNEE